MRLELEGLLENNFTAESNPGGKIEMQYGFYFSHEEKYYRLFYHLVSTHSTFNKNYGETRTYKILSNRFEKIDQLPPLHLKSKSSNKLVELDIKKEGFNFIVPNKLQCQFFYTNLLSDDPININYSRFKKN